MITIKSNSKSYGINIPSSPEEIKGQDLLDLVSHVSLPNYFAIIALRYRITLFELCMQGRNKGKKQSVSVVPLFVKANKETQEKLTFPCKAGDRILIDGSEIERGSHLSINTVITPDNIANYIISDEELNKASINHSLTGEKDDTIFCIEFKIVPVAALHGTVAGKNTDPYRLETPVNGK